MEQEQMHPKGVAVYGSLGEISHAQLQAALDRFGLGRLVSAHAFTKGLFGKNIGLVTDRGRWVLRGQPWPAQPTDEQFRRERFWASSVRARCGVPVPWPFHIEADEGLFGWPYQLTPWMPGTEERNAVGAAAVGRAAAALRAVTFDSFGEWSAALDGVDPFAGTAAEWLAARTQRKIDRVAETSEPLAESDVAFVASLLPEELDAVPTYVHHDLKVENSVCVGGEVSGVFDLGEGFVGDALEDLARSVWDLARTDPDLSVTFLRSYERAAGAQVPIARLRAYIVLDLLVIWEFARRPAQSWIPDSTFEGWVTRFMGPAEAALRAMVELPQ